MNLNRLLAAATLAVATISPAYAATTFSIDFEKNWDYLNGDVNNYYNGGTAADGTIGPNLGVSFTNVSGLSNDAFFTYYTKADSAQGVAYAHDTGAIMNVAAGVDGAANFLQFQYAATANITGAVKAYSGLNGSGQLLGTLDLVANDNGTYSTWNTINFGFGNNIAQSFDFTNTATLAGLDNIKTAPVPVPAALFLFAPAMAGLGVLRRRG